MSVSKKGNQSKQDATSQELPKDEGSQLNVQIDVPNDEQAEIRSYGELLSELKDIGRLSRTDQDQPSLSKKPSWFNQDLFDHVKSVYERHFMGINFAHLSGLLLLVRVDSIYNTLSITGQSDTVSKLFKRYYHTVKHVKTWYEGDIFDENNDAYKSLLIVRGMHNKVSKIFNDISQQEPSNEAGELSDSNNDGNESTKLMEKNSVESKTGKHISEFDVMLTQFAFVGLIVTNPKEVGLIDDFSRKDLESLLHFWRVIGYYLGITERFNLCSYELKVTIGLCEAIRELEYKESMKKNTLQDPPGVMSVNIVRSVKFIPMLTIYGIMRHLYEILGYDITELQNKRNWYSNLSYTLIKLVMTNLLAYKPLRSFNNGLTRLSIYLVNSLQDWFSNRLKSKYGEVLRA